MGLIQSGYFTVFPSFEFFFIYILYQFLLIDFFYIPIINFKFRDNDIDDQDNVIPLVPDT